MKFRTEYSVVKSSFILSPDKPVVMAGSCFTENIANKMRQHLWDARNPFGTLYNPYSISVAIELMLEGERGRQRFEKSLFENNGIWSSYFFDSSFSSSHREDCVKEFSKRQEEFETGLEMGRVLVITFGTSICYHLEKTGEIVGNCHKLPSSLFYRKRMSHGEIFNLWQSLLNRLLGIYPDLHVIFTVSPVRHLKDGFAGNMRSKAELILAVEEIVNRNKASCCYFPAYEIMNDDLRDYRFYAPDLVHPSEEGVQYIWDIFTRTFIDKEGERILSDGEKRWKAMNHRPKTGAMGKPIVSPV